jgi:hypothetical protein
MSDQPPITTPAHPAAEVRDAILKHVPDDRFAEVFGTLPPAARQRLARQFTPMPARVTFKFNRRQ